MFLSLPTSFVMYFPERFFQSNVITSEATAMDTTAVSVEQTEDIAPDKAPDLRSPWSEPPRTLDAPVQSPAGSDARDELDAQTVLRWTPAPPPHWRPVVHRALWETISSKTTKCLPTSFKTTNCAIFWSTKRPVKAKRPPYRNRAVRSGRIWALYNFWDPYEDKWTHLYDSLYKEYWDPFDALRPMLMIPTCGRLAYLNAC